MFQPLVICLILLTIIMIGCVTIANRKGISNRSSVVPLIWTAIVTTIIYIGFALVPSAQYRLAVFLYGLYFLSTDWLAICLMVFAIAYTRVSPPSKWWRGTIFFLAGADSVSYLVNTYTNHMIDLKLIPSYTLGREYWYLQLYPLHFVHLLFVYAIVLYCLIILGYRLVTSPAIYRSKYGNILFPAFAVVGLHIICTVLDTEYDYSIVLYASMAIEICYQALYVSPKKLLEKIHSTILEDSVVGLVAYDNDDKCVGVNEMARELLSEDGDIYAVAERYLSEWRDKYKDNSDSVIDEERTIVRKGKEVHIHVVYQKFSDEKGRIMGCCFQFEDRTEVVKRLKEEQYRATHDMLTGLLNRNAFEEAVKEILSKAEEPYCMVCSNLKDFKLVNELYGSETGDRLLIAQADMIRKTERESSASSRIYADQFCTLMPRSHLNERQFIDNMSAVMDTILQGTFKIHYYLGVYDITDVNEPVWTMYDKAMLAVDEISGNYEENVSYYRDELLEHILEEKEVIGEFDKAIEDKQFHMFLQPQIANDGTVTGAEALVRWIHPQKGMLNPGVFIPTLEKAGLIHRLDLYMWGSAARTLERWKKQGRDNLTISVNISTKDFYYLDVCEAFRVLTKQYDFNIKNLKLEITESALMENVNDIMNTLDRLHTMGYEIEIDDFGSGYSSLGMLKDIKADIIKIDMIFLQETKNEERSRTILKNIVSMSKELGMPVITEGVETKQHVDFLTQVGCDMFQGFYFAKPMSLEDFEKEYC